jgi:hypothetical protein
MNEIENSLDEKDVGGVGRLNSLGFEVVLTTDQMCAYRMDFVIDVFF